MINGVNQNLISFFLTQITTITNNTITKQRSNKKVV